MAQYRCETWLKREDSRNIRSNDYWNNEDMEEGKVFNAAFSDRKMFEQDPHLSRLYRQTVGMLESLRPTALGGILSLGAGTCWLESWLLRGRDFESLVAVDFSKHRIHKIAPETLAFYDIQPEKVTLVHGDILDLRLPDESQSLILLCQSFHHINEPVRLLREVRRVLKRDGSVVVAGEHYFSTREQMKRAAKHCAKYVLNYNGFRKLHSFCPGYTDLFPHSSDKGDIHYSRFEYHTIFSEMKFSYKHFIDKEAGIQGYVLRKN